MPSNQMPTEAFNSFVPPTQYKRAAAKVADILGVPPNEIASDENAPELLRLAQVGNQDALLVLYRKSRQAIGYVFWKNFIGPNKRFLGRRLDRGDDDLFASEAWARMMDALESFDVDKYDTERTTNFIGKWHWWFMQYLRSMAIQLNKNIDAQGFTGVGDNSGLRVSSMPEDDEGKEVSSVSLSSPGSEREIETESALDAFMKDLERDLSTSKRKRSLHTILQYRLEGRDLDEIAELMGTSTWNIRKLMRELKQEMTDYGLFEGKKKKKKDCDDKEKVEESYTLVPAWKPLSDLKLNDALRFKRRVISDMITHHISPCYLIVETTLPNRKATYTLYFRLPTKGSTRADLEYANHVDLLVSNHRTPRVQSMSMAKQLLRTHFKTRGEGVKSGIDPASPQSWLHAL